MCTGSCIQGAEIAELDNQVEYPIRANLLPADRCSALLGASPVVDSLASVGQRDIASVDQRDIASVDQVAGQWEQVSISDRSCVPPF